MIDKRCRRFDYDKGQKLCRRFSAVDHSVTQQEILQDIASYRNKGLAYSVAQTWSDFRLKAVKQFMLSLTKIG